jgi:hypothetical protein
MVYIYNKDIEMITTNVVLTTNTDTWVEVPIIGSILILENNSGKDILYRLGDGTGEGRHILVSGDQLRVNERVWVRPLKKTILARNVVLVVTT